VKAGFGASPEYRFHPLQCRRNVFCCHGLPSASNWMQAILGASARHG
jgi:hypothetical protein